VKRSPKGAETLNARSGKMSPPGATVETPKRVVASSVSTGSYRRQAPPLAETGMRATSMGLGELASNFNVDEWDLLADYQRGSVWDDEKAQKLVRSLLEGVPVGNITLAETSMSAFQETGYSNRVVDGKQRIEAIRKFTSGDLLVPLDWFPDAQIDSSVEPEFVDGVAYGRIGEQLNAIALRLFKSLQIGVSTFRPHEQVTEVEPGTGNGGRDNAYLFTKRSDEDALKEEARVFGLINSGGVAQTEETLAHARSLQ
jgi:hypothetical protein